MAILTYQGKNEYFINDNAAEMVLYGKNGNEKARCLMDLADVERCSILRWGFYDGYVRTYTKVAGWSYIPVMLHAYILNFISNRKIQVDHKNRDTLDNRRSNLRICTHHQNLMNNSQVAGYTGYRGAYYRGQDGSYRARIKHNGKLRTIGTFDTPEEAAIAWNEVALELRGEFAVLNEIRGS